MKASSLASLGLTALACVAGTSLAQAPLPSAAPGLEERLAAKAAERRLAVSFRDGAFSGPGWDLLVAEGRRSRFFLVGSAALSRRVLDLLDRSS